MGEYVSVESFEALKRLRAAMCRFAELVGAGLDEADAEMLRSRDWVILNQGNYWKRESKSRAEQLTRAKSALAYKKMSASSMGGRPSCVEEEKAVAVAKRRVEEAEQKQARVRAWSRRIDEEIFLYQAAVSGLTQARTTHIPNALAQLDNMLKALEAYVASAVPQMEVSKVAQESVPAEGGSRESMVRAVAPGAAEEVEYRRLKGRSPSQATRDSLSLPGQKDRLLGEQTRPFSCSVDPNRLGLARVPVAAEGKIVLARGVISQSCVYLSRLLEFGSGDSGWYVGNVAYPDSLEYDAVCIADVLVAWPGLAPLLELPPGCLVILNGAEPEVIFDQDGRKVWPVAEAGLLPYAPAGSDNRS